MKKASLLSPLGQGWNASRLFRKHDLDQFGFNIGRIGSHIVPPHPGPTHEPERRFVTGSARPNALSMLETGAPPWFRGTNREPGRLVESLQERAASLELAGGATRGLPVTNRQHAAPAFRGTHRGFSRVVESLPPGEEVTVSVFPAVTMNRFAQSRVTILPLRWGEGRGEGEGSDRLFVLAKPIHGGSHSSDPERGLRNGERARPRVPCFAPSRNTSAGSPSAPSIGWTRAPSDRRGRRSEHARARVLLKTNCIIPSKP